MLRDLRQPDGGFSSAEDADSPDADGHGHEGLFHTWTPDEVRATCSAPTRDAALEWYGITADGQLRGALDPQPPARTAASSARPPAIEDARRRLFDAREQRPRPGARRQGAHRVERADDRRRWPRPARCSASRLDRRRRRHRRVPAPRAARPRRPLVPLAGRPTATPPARHDALAADHAALVDAFTRLGRGHRRGPLDRRGAATSADTLLDHFWDVDHGGLFTTPDDGEALVARQKDLFDNATPSANSTAAVALYRLAALTGETALRQPRRPHPAAARRRHRPGAGGVLQRPRRASTCASRGITEVAVVGDRPDLVAVVRERWRPDVVLAWGEPYDSPLWHGRTDGLAYVCHHYACQAPQDTAEGLREQLA